MTAYLAVISGLPPQSIALEPGTFIAGRGEDAEIELTHVEISRAHCRFVWDGTQCTVEDMGSTRGTRVNGDRIVAVTTLEPGDRIGIGPAIVEFGLGEVPEPAATTVAATEAEAPPMLVHGQKADRVEIGSEVVIGRDADADVRLNDPAVSRRHASVQPGPHGGCIVTDLESSGGSFVNGHRFDTHEFTVGDRLQIGPFCLQFDGHALVRVAQTAGGTLDAAGVFAKSERGQVILDDVTLHISASRFVGILGPSGAGKSSLLLTLAGMRAPDGGLVLIDGEDVYGEAHARSFGFVPQEDIVHPELTVAQALNYAARLRLPAGTPPVELQKLLLQTMDQLGLRLHSDKPITRLSGGQRKRVSVGAELLAKPAVLFLDEPSSGLDPATEFQLMELLRDLADTGCTIVCTTHVMENAFLMDELVVLTGGCLVFKGPAQEAREYFGVQKLTALYDRLADRPAQEWQEEFGKKAEAEAPKSEVRSRKKADRSEVSRPFALPILLQRQFAILCSDWRNFLILAGQPLIIAGLVSWTSDDQSLLMFFAYIATLWFGCSNAAQEIVKEIAIYKRERLVGVGAHAYLASKFLFLTAVTSVQALLLYLCLCATEHGLTGATGWQVLGLLGTALAAVGIGAAISALARSVMQAVMIVPLVLIPQILFSGFTVEVRDMEPRVLFVSRLMPTFAAETLMDTSFLWQQRVAGDLISDHAKPVSNLRARGYVKTGAIYQTASPAFLALLTHLLWAAAAYAVALLALKSRERKS